MSRIATLSASIAGLALALLAAGCGTAPNPVATRHVDDYIGGFTPSTAGKLATAVELNAPKLWTGTDGVLHLTGTGDSRPISARALEVKDWKDIRDVVMRPEPKLPGVKAEQLIDAVVKGVTAKSASIAVYGTTIAVELSDVELPALSAHADLLTLFVHVYDPNSSTLAAAAANQGALNAIGTIRIGGSDVQ
jgi:hypothetical protein